jgi:hypothetical protein
MKSSDSLQGCQVKIDHLGNTNKMVTCRALSPAQNERVVYGLHELGDLATDVRTDSTLMAMDAPEVMPAGSHEGFDSVVLRGSRVAMESTVRRGTPYRFPTRAFLKDL